MEEIWRLACQQYYFVSILNDTRWGPDSYDTFPYIIQKYKFYYY